MSLLQSGLSRLDASVREDRLALLDVLCIGAS